VKAGTAKLQRDLTKRKASSAPDWVLSQIGIEVRTVMTGKAFSTVLPESIGAG